MQAYSPIFSFNAFKISIIAVFVCPILFLIGTVGSVVAQLTINPSAELRINAEQSRGINNDTINNMELIIIITSPKATPRC